MYFSLDEAGFEAGFESWEEFGQFAFSWHTAKESQEDRIEQLVGGFRIYRLLGDLAASGGTAEVLGQCAVGEDAGLKHMRILIAMRNRLLTGASPTKRLQYICDSLSPWQGEAWTVAFVVEVDKVPCTLRDANGLSFFQGAAAIVNEGKFFGIDRDSGRGVQRIDDLFCG